MKRRNVLFVLALALTANVQAASSDAKPQVIQKALLKNGSVLYGFIQKNDGRGNLTFQTDSAIINLGELRAEVTDRQVNENALSKEWKDWANANNAYMGSDNNRYLILSDVRVQSSSDTDSAVASGRNNNKEGKFLQSMRDKSFVSNVKVLERGVRTRYIEQTPNSYKINWYDIVSITTDPRPKTALSGINRIYQTKNGNYEGQYAGETRTTLSLYLPTGVMQTVNYADVVKYIYRPLNQNQSIFEQSELLDVIHVKNGTPVSGVIIEQDYSGNASENSVLIQQETGVIQSVKVSNIVEVAKERNPKYNPLFDIVLADGEVCVNRNLVAQTAIDTKKGVHTLKKLDPVVLQSGANNLTQVVVEYKAAYGSNVEAYQLVELFIEGKGKKAQYFFTDSNLANTTYRPISINTSVNGTTKAVYQVTKNCGYVLYDPRTKKAYAFVVQANAAK